MAAKSLYSDSIQIHEYQRINNLIHQEHPTYNVTSIVAIEMMTDKRNMKTIMSVHGMCSNQDTRLQVHLTLA